MREQVTVIVHTANDLAPFGPIDNNGDRASVERIGAAITELEARYPNCNSTVHTLLPLDPPVASSDGSNVAVTPDAVSIRISHELAERLMAAAGFVPASFGGDRVATWTSDDIEGTTTIQGALVDALETVAGTLA